MKKALIVAMPITQNGFRSGASLRIDTISNILKKAGYDLNAVNLKDTESALSYDWDLIVLCSFRTLSIAHKARLRSRILWFDPYDSWTLNRISRFKHGEFGQLPAYLIDSFWARVSPHFDLITFISHRDKQAEGFFCKKQKNSNVFIVPNKLRELCLSISKNRRYVFVGDLDYKPNLKAVDLLFHASKKLNLEYPIEIIGQSSTNHSYRGLVMRRYVQDSDLYRSSDIHISPIFEGSGIKNKVIEPLSLGLSVLTTPEGSVGIRQSQNLKIFNSKAELSVLLKKLDSNPLIQAEPQKDLYLDDQTEQAMKRILN